MISIGHAYMYIDMLKIFVGCNFETFCVVMWVNLLLSRDGFMFYTELIKEHIFHVLRLEFLWWHQYMMWYVCLGFCFLSNKGFRGYISIHLAIMGWAQVSWCGGQIMQLLGNKALTWSRFLGKLRWPFDGHLNCGFLGQCLKPTTPH